MVSAFHQDRGCYFLSAAGQDIGPGMGGFRPVADAVAGGSNHQLLPALEGQRNRLCSRTSTLVQNQAVNGRQDGVGIAVHRGLAAFRQTIFYRLPGCKQRLDALQSIRGQVHGDCGQRRFYAAVVCTVGGTVQHLSVPHVIHAISGTERLDGVGRIQLKGAFVVIVSFVENDACHFIRRSRQQKGSLSAILQRQPVLCRANHHRKLRAFPAVPGTIPQAHPVAAGRGEDPGNLRAAVSADAFDFTGSVCTRLRNNGVILYPMRFVEDIAFTHRTVNRVIAIPTVSNPIFVMTFQHAGKNAAVTAGHRVIEVIHRDDFPVLVVGFRCTDTITIGAVDTVGTIAAIAQPAVLVVDL